MRARVLRPDEATGLEDVERALDEAFEKAAPRVAPGGELERLGEVLTRWIGAGDGSGPDAESCHGECEK
jgi:hypothetical protein